ncbi:MAG: tetratricopeptide repeat protein [Acidobacteriota bacterium]
MRRALAIGVMLAAAGWAGAQQVPAGTHSVDEPSASDLVNQQILAAEADLEKQDFKAAEAKLQDVATKRPKDAHVLYDLGFAQESNSEEDAAAKSYAAAAAVDAKFIEPRVALGLLDARAGRVEAAHTELLEAARMDGADPQMRARALRALARLDKRAAPDAARDELLAAIKLTGETPSDVALTAELAERAGDAEDATTAYRKALALTPGDVDATAGLAHALRQQGKNADAEAVLVAALKDHPDDPRLVSQLAAVYVADGEVKLAVPLLEQFQTANPKTATEPAMMRMMAQVYAMNDQLPQAEKLYAQLASANPDDATLLDALGGVLVKEARYPEAQATLAKAAGMRAQFHDDAAWGDALGHLAFAASKNGHPEITLQALTARATVLPNSPVTLFLEATAHDTLHQYREAERAYNAFLAIAGGKFPDQEFQARHRLVALKTMR